MKLTPAAVRNLVDTLRTLHRAHGISPLAALIDLARFHRALGTTRIDFLMSHIWDRQTPITDRLRYLSAGDRRELELRMNPRPAALILRDKIAVGEMLRAAGLPAAPTLAVVDPERTLAAGFRRLASCDDLRALLAESHPNGIVCKPNYGMAGRDVLVFARASADELRHRDGSHWDPERLWSALNRPGHDAALHGLGQVWKIEPRVGVHPHLTAIHGDTLTCLRIVTMRFSTGEVRLLTPTWKIAVGQSGVDNVGEGSLTASVDPATGVVGRPVDQRTMIRHDRHPETGARITGLNIPDWPAPLDLAVRAMSLFPELRSLGFDIGVADSGPLIVEVNPWWGLQMMQAPQGRGLVQGDFLAFLEDLGAEDVIRRAARRLPTSPAAHASVGIGTT